MGLWSFHSGHQGHRKIMAVLLRLPLRVSWPLVARFRSWRKDVELKSGNRGANIP